MPLSSDGTALLVKDYVSFLSMLDRHTAGLVRRGGKTSEAGVKTAEPTGLEPATSAVTGQRSNQLS